MILEALQAKTTAVRTAFKYRAHLWVLSLDDRRPTASAGAKVPRGMLSLLRVQVRKDSELGRQQIPVSSTQVFVVIHTGPRISE